MTLASMAPWQWRKYQVETRIVASASQRAAACDNTVASSANIFNYRSLRDLKAIGKRASARALNGRWRAAITAMAMTISTKVAARGGNEEWRTVAASVRRRIRVGVFRAW
jgi:hypothetical protein